MSSFLSVKRLVIFLAFLVVLLVVILLFTFIGNKSEIIPDKSEYMGRMLNAFDNSNIQTGYVFFSFAEDVTKEQAVAILKKYDLDLGEREICSEVSDPGQPPRRTGCKVVDSWQDGIKGATIQVPVGKEKEYAKMLVEKESKVMFAEPQPNIEMFFG